jgi:hypothetical protein
MTSPAFLATLSLRFGVLLQALSHRAVVMSLEHVGVGHTPHMKVIRAQHVAGMEVTVSQHGELGDACSAQVG